jgi:hypothetical protein
MADEYKYLERLLDWKGGPEGHGVTESLKLCLRRRNRSEVRSCDSVYLLSSESEPESLFSKEKNRQVTVFCRSLKGI